MNGIGHDAVVCNGGDDAVPNLLHDVMAVPINILGEANLRVGAGGGGGGGA